ncbi:cytochrome P450 [Pseudomassariella vexata]|uniref:Cytochrome P450 n=1 Tax=Pseudomassariella vexata TaxID=1141098 RepID=A0A1Y2DUW9_9PEZI|nr:cytochrome P450 [Pseudomassariella vexata]ORY62979.1 cytochrome P450 [Pseudomassariella vexata]
MLIELKSQLGFLEERIATTTLSWSIIASQVVILVTTSLCLIFIRRRYLSPISHVPGPFLASFSRLWHLRQIVGGKQNLKLTEQHDKHGHFVRIAHNEVSVSHPNAVTALLLRTLPKGQWYAIVCFPDYRFTTPFSILDPNKKSECSKYLSTGYLLHNVIKSEPAMDINMKKFFGWMDKFADDQKPMDLDKFFTYVAFDITGEVVFSKPFGFMDAGEDVNNSIFMNMGMEMYIAIFGYMQILHTVFSNPFVTWLKILPMGHLFDTTMSALNERQKNPDAHEDLVAHWFRGLDKAKKDKSKIFDLRCLQSFATANVGAGSDTVSAGLQSFIYYLLRHPTGWKRCVAEMDAARKNGHCEGEVVSYNDATQLPYLQACIKEGLRMFAPVSMGLPRVAPKGGVSIGNAFFPEGITLSVNPSVIHHSKELWGPDAREFNPDRWLATDAASKEKYFIPWGVGYASCPGQHIARIQLSKISATIIRDYEIRQVDPSAHWQWSAWFTVVPHSWPVYITKRNKA